MTKLLSQHFRYTAFYSCSLIAWPKLSCVYCMGKASGCFFRHEMSDLLLENTHVLFQEIRTADQKLLFNYSNTYVLDSYTTAHLYAMNIRRIILEIELPRTRFSLIVIPYR